MTLLCIAVFAILGAFARYGQTQLVQAVAGRDFPWATLSINVLGSTLMGLLFFLTSLDGPVDPALRTGVLVGGLGAYTTFSTFSIETLILLEDGEIMKGFLYMFFSLVLCVGGAAVGAWISWHL